MKIPAVIISAFALASGACSSSPTREASDVQLSGTAAFACGVTDGPATKIVLAIRDAPESHYNVFVQDHSPEYLKGNYPVNSKKDNASSANIEFCADDTRASCTRAESGTFSVTANSRRILRGTLSFKTNQGDAAAYEFTAEIVPPPPNTNCG